MNNNKYLTFSQRQKLEENLHQDLALHQSRRIQIMLLADEGKSQREICQILGSTNATVSRWMHVARCGMAHEWQENPIGRPKRVSKEYIERLKELVNHSPHDYGYAFQKWTADWLRKQLAKEFGLEISANHIARLLRRMELSTR